MRIGVPSAFVLSASILTPLAPDVEFVSVPALGAGPGLYFDLATLIFHVPTWSFCARAADDRINITATRGTVLHAEFFMDDPSFVPEQ
jgi:hypothetical protein